MQLCELYIPNYQQFQDFHLDLTYPKGHPKEGLPLDKVCFIGANGTGKSILLKMIRKLFNWGMQPSLLHSLPKFCYAKFFDGTTYYYFVRHKGAIFLFNGKVDDFIDWKANFVEDFSKSLSVLNDYPELPKKIIEKLLFIYAPPESETNQLINLSNVPETNVNESLKLFEHISSYHKVSNDSIKDFWSLLIYHIKKREEDYLNFQNLPENQDKTIKEIKTVFNKEHPEILKNIAQLWNKILGKAGLYFDYETAKNPVQLNDNLEAYIKHKRTEENIPYKALSTGIRNFIFKLGHIYSLYFNRNIKQGYLLIDEPENSLFPDFLYELLEIYQEITENTHIFMATHSPIIAAQFEPEERIILKFDEETFTVKAHKGITPLGDDPNDLLIQDFGIQHLLGKEGMKKWERFIELKLLIKQTENKNEKIDLLEEYMAIGNAYNFPVQ